MNLRLKSRIRQLLLLFCGLDVTTARIIELWAQHIDLIGVVNSFRCFLGCSLRGMIWWNGMVSFEMVLVKDLVGCVAFLARHEFVLASWRRL